MSVDEARVPHGAAVPALTRWGLSPDADLAYRDLVTFGPRTTKELARDLAMPLRRAQAAVEELTAAGAASPEPNQRDRRRRLPSWRATATPDLLRELRGRRSKVVDLTEHHVRRHHDLLADISPATNLRVTHLASRAITRQRVTELTSLDRHEHLKLSTACLFTPAAIAAFRPLDRQLAARGVRLRTCAAPPTGTEAVADELVDVGAEYRELVDVPIKLMVYDRRTALVSADPLDIEAGMYEIDDPDVVDALVVLFEQQWSAGVDPRRKGVSSINLSPREKVILGLLVDGHTDSSVAQQLGISQRTIAYTLRALMDRLCVDNRFQLGLVLGAAHAVLPPTAAKEDKP